VRKTYSFEPTDVKREPAFLLGAQAPNILSPAKAKVAAGEV